MRTLSFGLSFAMAMPVALCHAQVKLDGTSGHGRLLTGPQYVVTSDLGQQSGTNLFFSFSQLNLSAGESATFVGPPSTANVIGRVTGGQVSSIDGLIDTRTSMPSANFFLLNPSGIVFGANASLNIGGSFHSSTADYLRFSDDSRFFSSLGKTSSFSVAAPVAFGFLGPTTGAISINGSNLHVDSGKTLSFVGGAPRLLAGTLKAPGGLVQLVAARTSEIPLSPLAAAKMNGVPVPVSSNGWSGDDTSARPIVIRSGQLLVDGASIASDLTRDADQPYVAIDIKVAGQITLANGAAIATSTMSGPGRGGDLVLNAASLDLSAQSSITTTTFSSAAGGDIHVTTRQLSSNDARIESLTLDSGAGGNISLAADGASFEGGGMLSLNGGTSTQRGGNIVLDVSGTLALSGADIVSELDVGTAGGNITIENAHFLKMEGGTILTLNAFEQGIGGNVSIVRVREMTLTGGASIASSGPSTGATGKLTFDIEGSATITGGASIFSISNAGLAGDIDITTGSMILARGALIQAGSFGSARGGSIGITTGTLRMSEGAGISSQAAIANIGPVTIKSGTLSLDNAYISTSTAGNGRAGSISLDIANLFLTNGGQIASASLNPARGSAGSITLTGASSVTISGSSPGNVSPIRSFFNLQDGSSGIFSVARASGPGGDIMITAQQLALRQGGKISASSTGVAPAGNVRIVFADMLSMDHSSIATSSRSANGGNITITSTGSTLFLNNSQITTSVLTALGNGGRITLGSAAHPLGALILADSFIQANAIGGAGGDIGLFADLYLRDGGGVSALSEFSRPGTIDVQARITDVSGSLVELPENPLQAAQLLRSACSVRAAEGRSSSLVVAAREGLPPEPDGLLSSPLNSLLDYWTLPSTNYDPVTQSSGVWVASSCTR